METKPKNQTPKFFRIAQMIGIVGVSILVINFFYQVWHIHSAKEVGVAAHLCNLQTSSCEKTLPNNRSLTLSITPQPIVPATPLTVSVKLTNMKPDHVAIVVFPYPATGSPAKPIMLKRDTKDSYTGSITIAKTANDKQRWIAMVVMESGTERISVPFPFDVPNSK